MKYQIPRFDSDLVKVIGAKLLLRKKRRPKASDYVAGSKPYFAPGQNGELHFGFVNCAKNPGGMQAEFFANDDGSVSSLWTKTERTFEGYPGLIHGGVLAALLDELMANALVCRLDRFGVTIKAEIEWLRALKIGEKVQGHAIIAARMGRMVKCEGRLMNEEQKICAKSKGIFYLPTLDQFKKMTRIDTVPTEIHPYFEN